MTRMRLRTITTAIAIVVILGWLAYLSANLFFSATTTTKLAVITASISVATFIYNNSRQKSREINSRQFSDKKNAYATFFTFFFDVMDQNTSGIEINTEQLIERSRKIQRELMIWGSADTINSYNDYLRLSLSNDPSDPIVAIQNTENLLRALRKDLGHDDSKLHKLGLSKLLVKPEDHHLLD